MKIKIRKSPTADTRTCDFRNVNRETLLDSSIQHIEDVRQGLKAFRRMLNEAADRHDHDKISGIDWFLHDFKTGFEETGWWDNHRKVNRHHLEMPDGVPDDVNLIDVLDYIADCVMAGMARSGSVRPLELPVHVLAKAFQNTAKLLEAQVVVYNDDGEADVP